MNIEHWKESENMSTGKLHINLMSVNVNQFEALTSPRALDRRRAEVKNLPSRANGSEEKVYKV